MKTAMKKTVCIMLAVVLLLSTAFADTNPNRKEETVYVLMNESGETQKKIVSVWVHSDDKDIDVEKDTSLSDVKNIKGEEEIVIENGKVKYASENSDVYYRGSTDKELPFSINIKYFLEGKELSPSEIAHKTGNVKIVISTENNVSKNVEIDEESRKIYLPMLIAGSLNLEAEKFSNVRVNRGKIISDAKNQVVSFVDVPGMKESFDFSSEELNEKWDKISGDVVIEAEAKDFSLEAPMFFVDTTVPELENVYDIDDSIDEFSDLKEKTKDLLVGVQRLESGQTVFDGKLKTYLNAVYQLNNGASKLSGAVSQLVQKNKQLLAASSQLKAASSQFVSGITAFASGSKAFLDGVNGLSAGATKLVDGASMYANGAITLAEKTTGLADGASKLEGSLNTVNENFKKANSSLNTYVNTVKASTENSIASLEKQIASYDAMIAGIDSSIGQVSALLQNEQTKAVAGELIAKSKAQRAGLVAMREASKNSLNALRSSGAVDAGNKLVAAYGGLQSGVDKITAGTKAITTGAGQLVVAGNQLKGKSEELKAGINSLKAGHTKLSAGVGQLNAGANQFKTKSQVYIDSVSKFDAGMNQFYSDGTAALNSAANLFSSKMRQLSGNNSRLLNGERQLLDGSRVLNDELSGAIDVEDEEKLDNLLNDLSTMSKVKDELENISEENKYFVENHSDREQSVRYIIKVKAVK